MNDDIVTQISRLISESLRGYANEASYPSSNADRMDDTLNFYKERTKTLRRLREEFENEMARVI